MWTCEYCGRVSAPSATVCACGAPPPAPRASPIGDRVTAAPTTRFDNARVADDAVRKVRGYGIPLDFSPASLLALDALLDSTVGEEGYAPHEEDWAPDPSQHTLILLYGSYLGEVARRRLGGRWQDAPDTDELAIRLILPGGEEFFPFARLWKRLRSGSAHGVLKAFDDLVAPLPAGHDAQSEAPQWVTMGDVFLAAGQPRVAERFYERARAINPRLVKAAEANERVKKSTMPPPMGPAVGLRDKETVRPSESRLVAEAARHPSEPPTPRVSVEEASPFAKSIPPPRPDSQAPPARVRSEPPAARPPSQPPAARPPSQPPLERPSEPPSGQLPSTRRSIPLASPVAPDRLPSTPPPARPASSPPQKASDRPPALAGNTTLSVPPTPPFSYPPLGLSIPPSSRLLSGRRSTSAADLSGDLCALGLAGDGTAIDEALAANTDLLAVPLIAELAAWVEQAAKDDDVRTREETCDAAMLLAERLGAIGQQTLRATLLERCARAMAPVLSVARRAEVLRLMALAQAEGDSPRRFEDAIAMLDAAVRLLDPKLNGDAWASLHRTMAEVQLRRTGSARKDAIDAAIGALHHVLRARNKKDHIDEWASAQLALGLAQRQRISGDRQRNADDALSSFRSAIEAATPETETWAQAKQGVGMCLMTSASGDRAKNGEEAIAALEESLIALPPGSRDASRSHYHLGLAYQRRKLGARAANLERAATHYRASLEGPDADGTGERQSLAENLEAAEREMRKLKAAGT